MTVRSLLRGTRSQDVIGFDSGRTWSRSIPRRDRIDGRSTRQPTGKPIASVVFQSAPEKAGSPSCGNPSIESARSPQTEEFIKQTPITRRVAPAGACGPAPDASPITRPARRGGFLTGKRRTDPARTGGRLRPPDRGLRGRRRLALRLEFEGSAGNLVPFLDTNLRIRQPVAETAPMEGPPPGRNSSAAGGRKPLKGGLTGPVTGAPPIRRNPADRPPVRRTRGRSGDTGAGRRGAKRSIGPSVLARPEDFRAGISFRLSKMPPASVMLATYFGDAAPVYNCSRFR